jgi:hypothetical protein
MQEDQQKRQSQLFMVRVWAENLGQDHREWRGQVRHVTSGDTQFFRSWDALIDFFTSARDSFTTEDETNDT